MRRAELSPRPGPRGEMRQIFDPRSRTKRGLGFGSRGLGRRLQGRRFRVYGAGGLGYEV